MKSFKQFIIEGGGKLNINGHVSTPIDTSTPGKRKEAAESHLKTLHAIQQHMKDNHGVDLFNGGKHLNTGLAFSGSSKALVDKSISHKLFSKHKKQVGDIDVKIPKEHASSLHKAFSQGMDIGDHHVIGSTKKAEVHMLMRHKKTGHISQVDFEPIENPTDKFSDFVRSSSFRDSRQHNDIKGLHHKVLLRAVSDKTHKFGNDNGFVPRSGNGPAIRDTHKATKTFFGPEAQEHDLHSFVGVTNLIKKHIPKERHKEIYDNYVDRMSKYKGPEHKASTEHLHNTLFNKNTLKEEIEDTHHVAGFFGGVDPHTHQGHITDMKNLYKKIKGKKSLVFGMSKKGTSVFSDKEKINIVKRQWGRSDKFHAAVFKSAGEVAKKAHDIASGSGSKKKVYHIMAGADRVEMAHNFARSLHDGKIKEMGDNKFDEVHVHIAPERTHGFSGTNMRVAASKNNIEEYKRHLGPNFSDSESSKIMDRTKSGLDSGKIKVKR